MSKFYLLALALLLGIAGCEDQDNPAYIRNSYIRYEGSPRHYAYEFRLTDGTRCVAYGDAITCEWRQPVVLMPRIE